MAYKCEVCGKKTSHGNRRSHSTIATKRTWKPNIQRVRAVVSGSPKRIYVCTRCLRSGLVQRSV